jgi:outer membrane protein assembly factor BamB
MIVKTLKVLGLVSITLLSGCAKKKAPPLEGERHAVLDETTYQSLSTKPAIKPFIDTPTASLSWGPQITSGHYGLGTDLATTTSDLTHTVLVDFPGTLKKFACDPVVQNDVLYTLSREGIIGAHHFDAAKNRWISQWTQTVLDGGTPSVAQGGLTVKGDHLFVTSGYGHVQAYHCQTGERLWSYQESDVFRAAPAVDDKRVYCLSADNRIVALNRLTGQFIWSFYGPGDITKFESSAMPVLMHDSVLCAQNTGDFVSVARQTGTSIWSNHLISSSIFKSYSAMPSCMTTPVVYKNRVYIGNYGGYLACFDGRTGTKIWQQPFSVAQSLWRSGNMIFAVEADGDVAAFHTEDGSLLWKVKPLDNFKPPFSWYGPVCAGAYVWLSSTQGHVAALDPYTGKVAKIIKTSLKFSTRPAVIKDQLVIFADRKGYAFVPKK